MSINTSDGTIPNRMLLERSKAYIKFEYGHFKPIINNIRSNLYVIDWFATRMQMKNLSNEAYSKIMLVMLCKQLGIGPDNLLFAKSNILRE